jgi:hypothetical protein
MWLITDQIKSKQCHFDVNRFSTSLMYDSQAYMLLAPWPVCFMDWWIQTWNLLHKQGSRNQLYALCPMARSWMPLSPLKIQRGLHDISILITLFLLMTLKSTTIDLPDHLHYLTYLSLSGVSTKQFAMQCFTGMVASVFLVWIIGNSIPFVCMNATTAYSHASQDPCVHL